MNICKCNFAFVLVFVSIITVGCVHWTGGSEHYFGPVAYRYITPKEGKAYVGQVIRLGMWAETGRNWGLTIGGTNQVTVDPQVVSVKQGVIVSRNRWLAPLSVAFLDGVSEWRFSPLYLRVEHETKNYFISDTLAGAGIAFGLDNNRLTAGYARHTVFVPPDNAIGMLHFQDDRPMDAKASVWLDVTDTSGLTDSLIKEVTQ